MSVVLQPLAEERLRSAEIAWLTTVRPGGRPHSVPLWFLWDGATVLIFSRPDTHKIRNLRRNRFVTLALDDTKKGVVILEGTAEVLEKGEAREALQAYGEKYREGLQRLGRTAEEFTMLYSQPIRITPARMITWQ